MKALHQTGSNRTLAIAAAAGLLLCLLGAYWPTLMDLVRKWSTTQEYSHGYLVPLIAAVLLWARRDQMNLERWHPSAWGIGALGVALLFRHVSAYYYYEWFEQLSLVFCVPGIALLFGGFAALRWAWPACLFLLFMIPLPYVLEVALRGPLRSLGTVASTYVMQTVGLPAYAEGMVIVVGDVKIGVAEACSGLSMLMVFFALSTAVAILVDQPLWRRLLIVVSAVPIALISNIARITAVGSLHALGSPVLAEKVHDNAEWPMMALALVLLWIEITLLDRLVIEETEDPTTIASPFNLAKGSPRHQFQPAIGKR